MTSDSEDLAARILALEEHATAQQAEADTVWVLRSAYYILIMQVGFALLEAGSVRRKNKVNIMMKNIMDFGFGGLTFLTFGYGLAFGTDSQDLYILSHAGASTDSNVSLISF